MGFEFKEGIYKYGEVWDGVLDGKLYFEEMEEFIGWLSQQSDASLARLEDKEPWYRGNQVINRERLKAFTIY